MKKAQSSVAPEVSWRRLLRLLRYPPLLSITPEQFATIQARIWKRLSHRLAAPSPSHN